MVDKAIICRRCLVDGHVQGVFYRASTLVKASELNVTGWARNMDDGRVEVVMQGTMEQLDALQDWLWEGSTAATVTSVQCESLPVGEYNGFGVRH